MKESEIRSKSEKLLPLLIVYVYCTLSCNIVLPDAPTLSRLCQCLLPSTEHGDDEVKRWALMSLDMGSSSAKVLFQVALFPENSVAFRRHAIRRP